MHLGTIYQATNWLYQDCRDIQLMPNYSVSLGEPHKWIHSRTVFSRYGSHNVEHLKNEIGHTFYRKRINTDIYISWVHQEKIKKMTIKTRL